MRPLLAAALLAATQAFAHGSADWIQADPRYKDRAGLHCCGVNDCAATPRDAVVRLLDGWRVVATGRVFRDGDPDLYDSNDERIWLCTRAGSDRCLFVPGAGA